jgi:predicted phosphoribosyltransferase
VEQNQQFSNYFTSRSEAGKLLLHMLGQYRYDDTIVLALSEGAVLVGAEIARELHSLITMLMTKDVYLPDGRTIVGVVNEAGGFIYNNSFSSGEIEELVSEYRVNIDEAKTQAVHELHVALGQGGLISPDYFRNRVVIVVSDGTMNGMAFEMANDYLKGIHTDKVIMVSPIAGVEAIDRMHLLSDAMFCLTVTDSVFDIDHYYEDNTMPPRADILKILNDIILQWNGAPKRPENTVSTASA